MTSEQEKEMDDAVRQLFMSGKVRKRVSFSGNPKTFKKYILYLARKKLESAGIAPSRIQITTTMPSSRETRMTLSFIHKKFEPTRPPKHMLRQPPKKRVI